MVASRRDRRGAPDIDATPASGILSPPMIAAVRRKPRPIDPAELDGRDSGAPATRSTGELRDLTGELLARHIATRDRYEQRFRDLVGGGIAAKEFAPADVALIAAGILSIGLGVGRWYRPGGRLTTDEIAAEYTR